MSPEHPPVQACLNGSRGTADHPAVPLTPRELAAAARSAAANGAGSVHLHPRDGEGRESLDVRWVEPAVRAVRRTCPGLPVGVSTGLWMCGGDAALRGRTVARWAGARDLPDFASVNLSEDGFEDLTGVLAEMDVGVEAGVWSERDARALLDGPRADSCTRVLVELIDLPPAEALVRADRILGLLRRAGSTPPVLLHGEGAATWPVLDRALALGLETRVGLEDTLTGPDGEPVADNGALVRLALARTA
ncbi:3-keto-5-aminohexanoate cleavage protein [uncultured Streptomyces sp.]|uniref:3-keto-5-aminohexanoate cleavage protein n=1 Tax=uncultured Streptomyces sp. TaxID=174707 RepID=UPI002629F42B|nr:3-keto-5-aminohexanoate cleavage protein [uncultured Streptomyces sp.]